MDALRTINPGFDMSLSVVNISMPGLDPTASCRCAGLSASSPMGAMGYAQPQSPVNPMSQSMMGAEMAMNQVLLQMMQMMLNLMLNRSSGAQQAGSNGISAPNSGASTGTSASGGASSAGGSGGASGGASAASGGPISATDTGKKLADIARAEATNGDSQGGLCYRDVGRSLAKVGINVSGASAYMAADQLAKNPKVKEVKVSQSELSKLPAGAIVVWDKGNGHEHGHISIATGDGKEASDLMRNQITNYGTSFRVFMPV